jgi:O-antigen/teichoic acid export membrane protein
MTISGKSKVVINTAYLYVRMFITMFVGLYSVRIVLDALGVEDYGVYNLVGGVVAMFAFMQGAMTVSTQRYLSYYIGKNQLSYVQKVFKSSVVLNLIIGLSIALILQIAYLFIFDNFLSIPNDKIRAAKFVYQMTVVSVFFTINAISYDSAINAQEDLYFDAIIGIVEVLLKLIAALVLLYFTDSRLEIYSLLILLTIIIARISKSVFCYFKYPQYRLKGVLLDRRLVKEMFSFAGWNTFGAACSVGRSQGIAVVLNLFFGATINAAYGIALQVNGQISGFAQNMLKALRPVIISTEGKGNRVEMLELAMMASKFSYFLLFFVSLPLLIEMEYILGLWLKNVPESTVVFCRLILILSLTNMLTIGLQTAQQATGKIKVYQAIVGSTILITPLFSYLAILVVGKVEYALWTAIVIEFIACVLRLLLVKRTTGLSITLYFKKAILSILLISIISSGIPIFIYKFYPETSFFRFLFTGTLTSVTLLVQYYFIGITQSQRMLLREFVMSKIK